MTIENRTHITVLVDNQAGEGLSAEHGLSLWIETADRRILFDTGQGTALPSNAKKLGIRLDETDVLVLSHAHYDHIGGVSHVVEHARKIAVYCHSSVLQPRYCMPNGTQKTNQIQREPLAINMRPAVRLYWVSEMTMISSIIGITGPIPRETDYEDTGRSFSLDTEGKPVDPMDDDIALWINTKEGLVVCVGCCHAGLVNTLNHVCRLSGETRIRAVIGGFHLYHAEDRRLERTAAALRSLSPEIVVPCHCTGDRAVRLLRNALGERVSPGRSGLTYRF